MENVELLIIGQGPAGLSAAIYAARAGVNTLVLGCDPKVAGDYDIDNYFGFPRTISGRELIERGVEQAKRFGTEVRCERVLALHHADDGRAFEAFTDAGKIRCLAILLATGVARSKPAVEGLKDFEGRGVSYCVSCDGFFFRGKPVAVVGEGDFAANQALELTSYTPQVTIITQGKAPTMAEAFRQRLNEAGIPIREDKIARLEGGSGLERLVMASGEALPADGLFVAMGAASSLDFAYSLGVTSQGPFIEADADCRTNIPGVFAAGDCIGGFLQISVAVGDGAKAARSAIGWVKEKRREASGT